MVTSLKLEALANVIVPFPQVIAFLPSEKLLQRPEFFLGFSSQGLRGGGPKKIWSGGPKCQPPLYPTLMAN